MKIYTKQGDAGETGLYGGSRVSKDHSRLHAYGTLDELNSALGLAVAHLSDPGSDSRQLVSRLTRIQGELFQLGAELATPPGRTVKSTLILASHISALEQEIDQMEGALPPLKTFILPGGHASACFLHLARSVSRRGERELIHLHADEPVRAEALQYVNRVSDYLFVCARYANHLHGTGDVPWISA